MSTAAVPQAVSGYFYRLLKKALRGLLCPSPLDGLSIQGLNSCILHTSELPAEAHRQQQTADSAVLNSNSSLARSRHIEKLKSDNLSLLHVDPEHEPSGAS